MTVWADDDEGQVQVEFDFDEKNAWLVFNKETSVLLMSHKEAVEFGKQWAEMLAKIEQKGGG
jgi:hypothetical protein